MARERLWLAGVDVATWAIRAIDLSGLLAVPEKGGENASPGGRHGTIHVPGKKYGGREIPMEFWIRGTTADGLVPADPKSEFYTNLRLLGRLLAQDVVLMEHQLPDGTIREIPVEVTASVSPARKKHGDLAQVKVVFTSAEAFWRSQNVITVPMALAHNGTRSLAEFALADAPIDDVVLTFGPGNGPDLYAVESGLFVAYDAVIPNGQGLIVDCGRKKLTGVGGLVPDRRLLRVHPTDGRWFAIDPRIGGPATVRLEHGGGATPMNVSLAARLTWMFG